MKKKFQVFLSSTFLDLREERAELVHALLSMGKVIPVGMELFPATSTDQWTHIETVISESDYYVLVVGGRYGSPTSDGISYTEKEYEYAQKLGIPTLAFLRQNIEDLPEEKRERGEFEGKLKTFRSELEQTRLCKHWLGTDLYYKVVSNLGTMMQEHDAKGWVRGDDIADSDRVLALTADAAKANARIETLEAQIAASQRSIVYADGDDAVELSFKDASVGIKTVVFKTTWNKILRFIGPSLFAAKYDGQFTQLVFAFLKQNAGAFNPTEFDVTSNKIKMQLVALGLVEEAGRVPLKTGGFGSLWALTLKGRVEVSRQIAEKKPPKLTDLLAARSPTPLNPKG